jgi:TP901 family phage tail tape measure protein
MATLVTTATIRAHDALTGPLRAMAAQVRAVNQSVKAGAERAAEHTRRAATTAAAAGYGLYNVIEKAQEFNKAIFGVGTGQLVDEKSGKTQVEFARKEMEHMTELALRMGRAMGFSSTNIAKAGEVLVKAGMKDGLETMLKATVSLSKADTETPANQIADYLHTLTTIFGKTGTEQGFGDWMRRQADMVLTAADQTKLSVGSIMTGMRQFQTLGANLGMKLEDMLPMMMAGAQAGFGPSEFGTMVKSDLTRLLKRAGPAQGILTRLGINMNDERFSRGTSSVVEVNEAIRNLRNSVRQYGSLGGKDAAALGRMIEGGARDPNRTKDSIVDEVTAYLSNKLGKTTDKDRAAMRQAVESSILAKTGDLNPLEVLKAMIEKGATEADYGTVFEGRHIARNAALRQAMIGGDKSQFEQWRQLLQRMQGQGLDAVETLWSKSIFGNVEAMKASFERMWIALANTKVVQQFVNSIERFVDGLGKIDPALINTGMQLAGLGVGLMIAGPLLAALATPLGLIASAAVLAASAFPGVLDGLKSLGKSMMDLGSRFSSDFSELFAQMKQGDEWAKFQESLGGIKEAMGSAGESFGDFITKVTGIHTASELMGKAAQLAVNGIEMVAAAFNKMYDFLAWMGLVKSRASDQTNENATAAGLPSLTVVDEYRKFLDELKGPRSSTNVEEELPGRPKPVPKTSVPSVPQVEQPGMSPLPFDQVVPSVDIKPAVEKGMLPVQSAADALTRAATAIEAAAGRLQTPAVVNGGGGSGPAASPAPTTTNGGGYGRK